MSNIQEVLDYWDRTKLWEKVGTRRTLVKQSLEMLHRKMIKDFYKSIRLLEEDKDNKIAKEKIKELKEERE